jgi:hypothetical protein
MVTNIKHLTESERYISPIAAEVFKTPTRNLVQLAWVDRVQMADDALGLAVMAERYLSNEPVRVKNNFVNIWEFLRITAKPLTCTEENGNQFVLPLYGGGEHALKVTVEDYDELCTEATRTALDCLFTLQESGCRFTDFWVATIVFAALINSVLVKLKTDKPVLFDRVDQEKLFEPFIDPSKHEFKNKKTTRIQARSWSSENFEDYHFVGKSVVESSLALDALDETILELTKRIASSSRDELVKTQLLTLVKDFIISCGFVSTKLKKTQFGNPSERHIIFEMFCAIYCASLANRNLLSEHVIRYLNEDLFFTAENFKELQQIRTLDSKFLAELEAEARRRKGRGSEKFKLGRVPFRSLSGSSSVSAAN